MFKKVLFFLLLTINIYAWFPFGFNVDIPEDSCALVVASAKYKSEMERYINVHNIKNFKIYMTKNIGWYSLVIKNINYQDRIQIISKLIEKKEIPSDSYCSKSNKFIMESSLDVMPSKKDINSDSIPINDKNKTQLNNNNLDKKEINENIINKPLDIENKLSTSNKITKTLNKFNEHIFMVNNKFYDLDKNLTALNNTLRDFKFKVIQSSTKPKDSLELEIITNYIEATNKKLKNINTALREIYISDNFKYPIDKVLATINSKVLDIYSKLNKQNHHNNLIDIQKPLLRSDINLTNLNYQESFTEMNKKMDNLLKIENMFKSFSISENIDLFFAEIDDENKYNSKFIYEVYLYGFIFILFILLSFFILRFKNKHINQEIIYLEEPKSLMDVDENVISKLIASRVFSYTKRYDVKIVIFKNFILFIGITLGYIVLFYFWYSYIHKFDRLHMLEEYKYKVQLEQNIIIKYCY